MIACVTDFFKYDKDFIKNNFNNASKVVYELFRKQYEQKPRCESENPNHDSKKIYKCVMNNGF